jgi:hypothetical protein
MNFYKLYLDFQTCEFFSVTHLTLLKLIIKHVDPHFRIKAHCQKRYFAIFLPRELYCSTWRSLAAQPMNLYGLDASAIIQLVSIKYFF